VNSGCEVSSGWRFAVDCGGTFTDLVGTDPSGAVHVTKVLSGPHAPLEGIRQLLGLGPCDPIAPCEVRLGTTLATNALLERKGAPCALMISRGFGDLLEIGTQARPDIFALEIRKPARLYQDVIEVDARLDARGQVLARPDSTAVLEQLRAVRKRGPASIAIVVVHAYLDGRLERELGALAREAGFSHVALSHEVAPELGLLRRADTTVLDAYLTPVLAGYLAELERQLPGSELWVMQSSGELTTRERLRGVSSLLSGPAGGVIGYTEVARRAGVTRAVGFDMGGTSTDVSRTAGLLPRRYETEIAGVRVLTPMLDVHTVASGAGSLCTFDGHALRVGPQSAGSNPGPACYGRATAAQLTVTDVNLLLGRLQPDRFPFALSRPAAEAALARLQQQMAEHGAALERDELVSGLWHICNENMAGAIGQVSAARGFDVREDTLIVFGGAGGQHACALAQRLGIRGILFHPHAGVLSAFGISVARRAERAVQQLTAVVIDDHELARAAERLSALCEAAQARLALPQEHTEQVRFEQWLDLRYAGSDTVLSIPNGTLSSILEEFELEHRQRYGYTRPEHPIQIVALRVAAEVEPPQPNLGQPLFAANGAGPKALRHERIYCGRWLNDVPVFAREDLGAGQELTGPACVLEATGTIVLDPGFLLHVQADGCLKITALASEDTAEAEDTVAAERAATSERPEHEPSRPSPVLLQLIGRSFMGIAQRMGEVLRRTALSTNIRERLDFSCALFDPAAKLIANAPHIPVHLGAMSESVADIARLHPNPNPGDVYATNDPAHGGSHLPDITVVTPVFFGSELGFYVANRGHHADVGGITPGSMPPQASSLAEEGVVLRGLQLVRDGRFEREAVLSALSDHRYPARTPLQNLADLEAQVAANELGVRLLTGLAAEYGLGQLQRYVGHLQDQAASRVRELLCQLGPGPFRFDDALDDGTPIGVNIVRHHSKLRIEFAPTPEHASNANAPYAVALSAVIYVLRCLVADELPLNSGCLRDVEVVVQPGTLLNPGPERAVSSGNVETSQRIVDVLLGALGRAAASQGTMNNLSFGNADFAYYETIGGGSGAGATFDGASGVQVHMTNTRITDVEVLESRYPVHVVTFALRRGSGGGGHRQGGDGLIRELCFLEPVHVSLVTERRTTAPFGLMGGSPGVSGLNSLNGRVLPGRVQLDAAKGDRLRLETPGGGGFGATDQLRGSRASPPEWPRARQSA
jgi:5-oxoprolinase (ATP-hydrolysing)